MVKVLFICIHNSARSQMAEAYCKQFGGSDFEVESAGLEPGNLNPYVVRVLKEDGIDILGEEDARRLRTLQGGEILFLRRNSMLPRDRGEVSNLSWCCATTPLAFPRSRDLHRH